MCIMQKNNWWCHKLFLIPIIVATFLGLVTTLNMDYQSKVLQIAELHVLLSMITPNNWVERDPTLKDMVKILKNKDEGASENMPQLNYGLLGYPVLMSADIMALNGAIVPVGVDQLAHLEITRDIARRFNNIYKTELFNEPKPKLTQIPLLQGVDGQKMGKSFQNDIKISDDEETTEKVLALSDALDEIDDVQNVYHNLDA